MIKTFPKIQLLLCLLGCLNLNLIAKADENYPANFITAIDDAGTYFNARWLRDPLLIDSPAPTVFALDKADIIWEACNPT